MTCAPRPHLEFPLSDSLAEKLALAPPIYSPSVEAPSYSVEPGPNEQSLASTSRLNRPLPTGIFTRSSNFITIALKEQEEHASHPTYGRNGNMSGEIGLSCTQGIRSVHLKLTGRLSVALSDGAPSEYPFLNSSYAIWKADGSSAVCPSLHTFECILPTSYRDGTRVRGLPPSYDGTFSGASDIYVYCQYAITVSVTKNSKLSLWKPSKKLVVPFLYCPRSRPSQPILSCPFPFCSTIKSLPEEWSQVIQTMRPKSDCVIEPIDCHLFIPVIQSYAITDTIPFYLQLRAPLESLHSFLYTTVSSSPKLKRLQSNLDISARPVVRVYILRQVTAVIRGQRSSRSAVIGEGTLRSLPPADSTTSSPLCPPDDGCGTLDWEGEVKCNPNVTVGTFGAGRFYLRDFIVLHLAPPNSITSPLHELQHPHPIRLCTNSFMEVTGPMGFDELLR